MAVALGQQPSLLADQFAGIYEQYRGIAHAVARSHVRDDAAAADVVQDVFLSLWLKSGQFDPDRGSLKAWIAAAARNRAIDTLRRWASRGAHETELPESLGDAGPAVPGVEEEAIRGLDADTIRQAMAQLPEPQRQVIDLIYLSGWSQQQAASRLGVPLSTIKGRSRIGLEKMRQHLAGAGLVN